MKRKNKLPKYWLGTAVPRGYQQANTVGFQNTTRTKGIDVSNGVSNTTLVADAVGKGINALQAPLQASQYTKTLPIYGLIKNPLAASTIAFGSSQLPTNVAAGLSTRIGLGKMGSLASNYISNGQNIAQIGTKTALTTPGKLTAGAGALYSGINTIQDFVNQDTHRTPGQMLDTRGVDTITTGEGNTYKQYGPINAGAELEYGKKDRLKKQLGLTTDLMGLGAGLGSFIPGIGTLLGAGLGAAAGLLGGGVASLLGFGDTQEDIQEALDLATAQTARQNRQELSVAEDADTKSRFANNRAANGKLPGYKLGKGVARLSGGELVELGPLKVEVPGRKNNKDEYIARKGTLLGEMMQYPEVTVYPYKGGIADYVKRGGDKNIALNAMRNLQTVEAMKKIQGHKNGKLPGYRTGLDGLAATIAHAPILFGNKKTLEEAEASKPYAPDVYSQNSEGQKALDVMAALRYDARPYYEQAGDALRQANWNTARQPGLGMGGRAIAQNANFNAYLQNLMKVNWAANEATNNYRQAYAKMLAEQGARNQQLRIQSDTQKHQWMQQANAARENWIAQYKKNIATNWLDMISEYMKWGQYNDTKDIQNKQLSLWDRQTSAEEGKINALIANLGNNNTNTSNNTTITPLYNSVIPQLSTKWNLWQPEYPILGGLNKTLLNRRIP